MRICLPELPIEAEQTSGNPQPNGFADVVIIGAGPAGLIAALTAKRKGAGRIVILERRSKKRTRVNMLLLDAGIVADIERAGADTSGFAPAANFTFIDASNRQLYQFPLKRPRTDMRERFSVFDMVPRRAPHSDVCINELEQLLIDAINRTSGIELIFDARIDAIKSNKMHTLIRFTHQNETCLLNGLFIGVCDGAQSKTLEMIGGKRIGKRTLESAVLTNFQQAGVGQAKFETDGRTEEVLTLRGASGSTVSVTLPPGSRWESCNLQDEAQRQSLKEFVIEKAKKVGVEGPIANGPVITQVVLGRSNRSIYDHNIFVMGDALRSSTPRLGLGANWAIRDGVRFAEALRMCRSKNHALRYLARPWFRFNSRLATHIINFLSMMLGVKRPPVDATATTPGRFSHRFMIFRKQLLFRYNWRSGRAIISAYDENAADHSIEVARQLDNPPQTRPV